jgi:hypothetical protein
VAVLASFGISGRECNVLHSIADRVPRDFIMRSRQYDNDEWRARDDWRHVACSTTPAL